jgi:hypothetical protein
MIDPVAEPKASRAGRRGGGAGRGWGRRGATLFGVLVEHDRNRLPRPVALPDCSSQAGVLKALNSLVGIEKLTSEEIEEIRKAVETMARRRR